MASSLNRVTLIGNLTRDPELRKTTGGQSVASFTIATNRAYTSSDGQKRYRTEVVIENMIMLDRSGQTSGAPRVADGADAAAEAAAAPNMTDEPSQTPAEEIKLEDIPF